MAADGLVAHWLRALTSNFNLKEPMQFAGRIHLMTKLGLSFDDDDEALCKTFIPIGLMPHAITYNHRSLPDG
jgi:hypothetical protein